MLQDMFQIVHKELYTKHEIDLALSQFASKYYCQYAACWRSDLDCKPTHAVPLLQHGMET